MTASRQGEPSFSVLVVDDEDLLLRSCARILEHEGYSVLTARRGREALEIVRRQRPEIILADLVLPDLDGLVLLREAKRIHPQALVVMITGFASVDSCVEAIRAGAYDYIPKPFTATQLQIVVGRAAKQIELQRDNERLRGELRGLYSLENVIGTSEAMQKLVALVLRVAPTEASVFISGESGTGKELIARGIHLHSRRADQPFVAVNCAAFPENLLESELFGHEKGAFTGADSQKRGLVEFASGGTFFLDEICEMSQELQAKLLRVLQERTIRRVGGEAEIPVDIRVIAATNRDPEEAVESGVLRQDLLVRQEGDGLRAVRAHDPEHLEGVVRVEVVVRGSGFDVLRLGRDDGLLPLGRGTTRALKTLHWVLPLGLGRSGAAASTTASTSLHPWGVITGTSRRRLQLCGLRHMPLEGAVHGPRARPFRYPRRSSAL